jgi:DNA-binding winged helix-turn-helix (wHTH) protein
METVVAGVRVYCFGAFTLDARTGELTGAGSRTPLREQSLQLLLALLEQPGEVVTREELTSRLWPAGTFVDVDRGLNKAVNHLREALGDSAEHPRFIETLPRKGYRFIAPVTRAGEDVEPAVPDGVARGSRGRTWVVAAALFAGLGVVIGADVGGARTWLTSRSRPVPQISALAVIPLEDLSHDPEQEYSRRWDDRRPDHRPG